MKYMKRAKVYKATNLSFDPHEIEARSYSWWIFVKIIKGKIVFNDFHYSNTTNRHQYKVRSIMRELGIKIDTTIEAPKGLQDLGSAVQLYAHRIENLEYAIAKPRSHRSKNLERLEQIAHYKNKIRETKKLARV